MTTFQYGPGESFKTFWSDYVATLTITSTAADTALPSITIPSGAAGLPAGAIITKVEMMLKYRTVEDSSAAENKIVLAGTEHIQIDKTGGTYIDAIKLVAGMAKAEANSESGGDVWMGNIDISSEVDGADTYETRWEGADCTGNNLIFNDLQVGVRVYFI